MTVRHFLVHPDALSQRGFSLDNGRVRARKEGLFVGGGMYGYVYESLVERFASAMATASTMPDKHVVVEIDSPGGMLSGCFEAANDLKKLCAQYPDVKVTVFSSGLIASAAYALAAAMTPNEGSEIVVTPQAEVGSIGVVAARYAEDLSVSMPGMSVTYFASGKAKTYGRIFTELSEEEAAKMQSEIDTLGGKFFALVASTRSGLSADKVEALEANTYLGEEAVSKGLADRVVASRSELFAAQDPQEDPQPQTPPTTEPEDPEAMSAEQNAQLQAQLEAANARIASMEAAQMTALLESRPDLEAIHEDLRAMGIDAASKFAAKLPKPTAAPVEPTPAPAAPAAQQAPVTTVAPLASGDSATEASGDELPNADARCPADMLRVLDSKMKPKQLSDARKKRLTYDALTGTVHIK